MENLAKKKVGEIVAANFRASTVLTAHGIDFCCGGGITLEAACLSKSEDLACVVEELQVVLGQKDITGWKDLELDELIEWIMQEHHSYVQATIPALLVYLDKLCKVHGAAHPELIQIQSLFSDAAHALLAHMKKEEEILFPYIKAMVMSLQKGFPLSKPHFEDIRNPISGMKQEHQIEGNRFEKISRLTSNYNCPPDACQTYRVCFALLKEFEEDLHRHIHLENNILFPAAQDMFEKFQFSNSQ